MHPGWPPDSQPGVANAVYASVGTTWSEILPAHPRRRAVVIGCPPSFALQLSFDPNAPAGTPGVTLYPNSPVLILTRAAVGGMVVQPIFAQSPGGAQGITILVEQGGPLS